MFSLGEGRDSFSMNRSAKVMSDDLWMQGNSNLVSSRRTFSTNAFNDIPCLRASSFTCSSKPAGSRKAVWTFFSLFLVCLAEDRRLVTGFASNVVTSILYNIFCKYITNHPGKQIVSQKTVLPLSAGPQTIPFLRRPCCRPFHFRNGRQWNGHRPWPPLRVLKIQQFFSLI